MADDGCEVTLTDDPLNCGQCGHDCLGGSCEAGECAPVLLADIGSSLHGLALDDTHAYVIEGYHSGSVVRVPKAGGAVETLTQRNNTVASRSIRLTGSHVYWSESVGNASSIRRVVKTGGIFETLQSNAAVGLFAVDEQHLFYYVGQDGLWRMPSAGGAEQQVYPHFGAVVIYDEDSSHIYYKAGNGLGRLDKTSLVPEGVSSSLGGVFNLVQRGGYLYWHGYGFPSNTCNPTGALIHRVPVTGGSIEDLVAVADPISLDVDADSMWVVACDPATVSQNDFVYRVPLGGGQPVQVQSSRYAKMVRVDETAIYWTRSGELWKLAK